MSKILPSKRLISSKVFKIEKLNHDNEGYLDFHQENIRSSLTGSMIDYFVRTFVLRDLNSFTLPITAALIDGNKKQQNELKHDINKYVNLIKKTKEIDNLDDEAFYLMLKIAAWEEDYRSGKYQSVKIKPNKLTIEHYKLLIRRMEHFFTLYGKPIEIGYGACSDNGQVSGDGDYLLPNILVDLKVSQNMITANWIRQLLLYYVLLRSHKINSDNIKKLMIVNPRYDQIVYVNTKDIDLGVLDFVLDQAELISEL